MQAGNFDFYQPGNSPIHRLDPRVKVIFTVLFILSNVLVPDGAWLGFVLAWGVILLIALIGQLRLTLLLKRSLLAFPFALAAVTIIFTAPGEPIASFTIGPWTLTATDAGLIRFSSIVIRSWLSVQMAILLTAFTQFSDLMHALRHLKLPHSLVAVISFTYRYLFVLTEEVGRLLRAREARSARLPGVSGGGSLRWRAGVAGSMVGQLFLRSYERSERVYNAMLSRGYRGYFQTLNPHVMRPIDYAAGAMGVLALLIIQLAARLTV